MPQSARPIRDPGEGLGSLALDFLHTLRRERGGWVDHLDTPQALTAWLEAHVSAGGRPRPPLSLPEARVLLDEARRLRADVAGLVEGHASGHVPEWARFGVNRVLAASATAWRLEDSAAGPTLAEELTGASNLVRLGPVALAAARLVTTVPPDRVRRCASERCGTWFADTSKGGQRRWCSMARCGNREKAAVHRAKTARG